MIIGLFLVGEFLNTILIDLIFQRFYLNDVIVNSLKFTSDRGGETESSKPPGVAALDVTTIQAEPGKGCPRCGGKVFAAEEMMARGRVRILYFFI